MTLVQAKKEMTLAQAEKDLAALKDGLAAPRKSGWDLKLLYLVAKRYGSVETWAQAEIRRIEEAIRLHTVALLDEE